MKHLDASIGSRFGAYLIDFILIGIVNLILLNFVAYPLLGYDPTEVIMNKLEIFQTMELTETEVLDLLREIIILYGIELGISYAILLPLVFLYMCLLPYFWENQTVGRMLFHVRVVSMKDEEKVSLPKLLIRELLGYIVMSFFSGTILIFVLLIVVLNKKRSICDYMASTRLINVRQPIVEEPQENPFAFFDRQANKDYMDAEVHEVHSQEETNSSSEESSEDDYKVI